MDESRRANPLFKQWVAGLSPDRRKHNLNNVYQSLRLAGRPEAFREAVAQLAADPHVPLARIGEPPAKRFRRSSVAGSTSSADEFWGECAGESDTGDFESEERALREAMVLSEQTEDGENFLHDKTPRADGDNTVEDDCIHQEQPPSAKGSENEKTTSSIFRRLNHEINSTEKTVLMLSSWPESSEGDKPNIDDNIKTKRLIACSSSNVDTSKQTRIEALSTPMIPQCKALGNRSNKANSNCKLKNGNDDRCSQDNSKDVQDKHLMVEEYRIRIRNWWYRYKSLTIVGLDQRHAFYSCVKEENASFINEPSEVTIEQEAILKSLLEDHSNLKKKIIEVDGGYEVPAFGDETSVNQNGDLITYNNLESIQLPPSCTSMSSPPPFPSYPYPKSPLPPPPPPPPPLSPSAPAGNVIDAFENASLTVIEKCRTKTNPNACKDFKSNNTPSLISEHVVSEHLMLNEQPRNFKLSHTNNETPYKSSRNFSQNCDSLIISSKPGESSSDSVQTNNKKITTTVLQGSGNPAENSLADKQDISLNKGKEGCAESLSRSLLQSKELFPNQDPLCKKINTSNEQKTTPTQMCPTFFEKHSKSMSLKSAHSLGVESENGKTQLSQESQLPSTEPLLQSPSLYDNNMQNATTDIQPFQDNGLFKNSEIKTFMERNTDIVGNEQNYRCKIKSNILNNTKKETQFFPVTSVEILLPQVQPTKDLSIDPSKSDVDKEDRKKSLDGVNACKMEPIFIGTCINRNFISPEYDPISIQSKTYCLLPSTRLTPTTEKLIIDPGLSSVQPQLLYLDKATEKKTVLRGSGKKPPMNKGILKTDKNKKRGKQFNSKTFLKYKTNKYITGTTSTHAKRKNTRQNNLIFARKILKKYHSMVKKKENNLSGNHLMYKSRRNGLVTSKHYPLQKMFTQDSNYSCYTNKKNNSSTTPCSCHETRFEGKPCEVKNHLSRNNQEIKIKTLKKEKDWDERACKTEAHIVDIQDPYYTLTLVDNINRIGSKTDNDKKEEIDPIHSKLNHEHIQSEINKQKKYSIEQYVDISLPGNPLKYTIIENEDDIEIDFTRLKEESRCLLNKTQTDGENHSSLVEDLNLSNDSITEENDNDFIRPRIKNGFGIPFTTPYSMVENKTDIVIENDYKNSTSSSASNDSRLHPKKSKINLQLDKNHKINNTKNDKRQGKKVLVKLTKDIIDTRKKYDEQRNSKLKGKKNNIDSCLREEAPEFTILKKYSDKLKKPIKNKQNSDLSTSHPSNIKEKLRNEIDVVYPIQKKDLFQGVNQKKTNGKPPCIRFNATNQSKKITEPNKIRESTYNKVLDPILEDIKRNQISFRPTVTYDYSKKFTLLAFEPSVQEIDNRIIAKDLISNSANNTPIASFEKKVEESNVSTKNNTSLKEQFDSKIDALTDLNQKNREMNKSTSLSLKRISSSTDKTISDVMIHHVVKNQQSASYQKSNAQKTIITEGEDFIKNASLRPNESTVKTISHSNIRNLGKDLSKKELNLHKGEKRKANLKPLPNLKKSKPNDDEKERPDRQTCKDYNLSNTNVTVQTMCIDPRNKQNKSRGLGTIKGSLVKEKTISKKTGSIFEQGMKNPSRSRDMIPLLPSMPELSVEYSNEQETIPLKNINVSISLSKIDLETIRKKRKTDYVKNVSKEISVCNEENHKKANYLKNKNTVKMPNTTKIIEKDKKISKCISMNKGADYQNLKLKPNSQKNNNMSYIEELSSSIICTSSRVVGESFEILKTPNNETISLYSELNTEESLPTDSSSKQKSALSQSFESEIPETCKMDRDLSKQDITNVENALETQISDQNKKSLPSQCSKPQNSLLPTDHASSRTSTVTMNEQGDAMTEMLMQTNKKIRVKPFSLLTASNSKNNKEENLSMNWYRSPLEYLPGTDQETSKASNASCLDESHSEHSTSFFKQFTLSMEAGRDEFIKLSEIVFCVETDYKQLKGVENRYGKLQTPDIIKYELQRAKKDFGEQLNEREKAFREVFARFLPKFSTVLDRNAVYIGIFLKLYENVSGTLNELREILIEKLKTWLQNDESRKVFSQGENNFGNYVETVRNYLREAQISQKQDISHKEEFLRPNSDSERLKCGHYDKVEYQPVIEGRFNNRATEVVGDNNLYENKDHTTVQTRIITLSEESPPTIEPIEIQEQSSVETINQNVSVTKFRLISTENDSNKNSQDLNSASQSPQIVPIYQRLEIDHETQGQLSYSSSVLSNRAIVPPDDHNVQNTVTGQKNLNTFQMKFTEARCYHPEAVPVSDYKKVSKNNELKNNLRTNITASNQTQQAQPNLTIPMNKAGNGNLMTRTETIHHSESLTQTVYNTKGQNSDNMCFAQDSDMTQLPQSAHKPQQLGTNEANQEQILCNSSVPLLHVHDSADLTSKSITIAQRSSSRSLNLQKTKRNTTTSISPKLVQRQYSAPAEMVIQNCNLQPAKENQRQHQESACLSKRMSFPPEYHVSSSSVQPVINQIGCSNQTQENYPIRRMSCNPQPPYYESSDVIRPLINQNVMLGQTQANNYPSNIYFNAPRQLYASTPFMQPVINQNMMPSQTQNNFESNTLFNNQPPPYNESAAVMQSGINQNVLPSQTQNSYPNIMPCNTQPPSYDSAALIQPVINQNVLSSQTQNNYLQPQHPYQTTISSQSNSFNFRVQTTKNTVERHQAVQSNSRTFDKYLLRRHSLANEIIQQPTCNETGNLAIYNNNKGGPEQEINYLSHLQGIPPQNQIQGRRSSTDLIPTQSNSITSTVAGSPSLLSLLTDPDPSPTRRRNSTENAPIAINTTGCSLSTSTVKNCQSNSKFQNQTRFQDYPLITTISQPNQMNQRSNQEDINGFTKSQYDAVTKYLINNSKAVASMVAAEAEIMESNKSVGTLIGSDGVENSNSSDQQRNKTMRHTRQGPILHPVESNNISSMPFIPDSSMFPGDDKAAAIVWATRRIVQQKKLIENSPLPFYKGHSITISKRQYLSFLGQFQDQIACNGLTQGRDTTFNGICNADGLVFPVEDVAYLTKVIFYNKEEIEAEHMPPWMALMLKNSECRKHVYTSLKDKFLRNVGQGSEIIKALKIYANSGDPHAKRVMSELSHTFNNRKLPAVQTIVID